MRIWDLPPKILCRPHLLGEHRELHAIWNVLTKGRKGYARHPETLRWRGRLRALYNRHQAQVYEMRRRGYRHHSDLPLSSATGSPRQIRFLHTVVEQKRILKMKGCLCCKPSAW